MPEDTVLRAMTRHWWVLAVRGLAAVLFGIGAFLWPGLTLAVLVLLWGAYALVDGVAAVVAGARARWWSLLIVGLIGIVAGAFTFFRPGITAVALLIVIAAWAIARGIFEIVAAVRLRKELPNEWLLILSGLASVAFGVLAALFPGAGALSIVWLIGIYALAVGILLLVLGFRLRSLPDRLEARLATQAR